ncbi:MAG: ribulose-phosphate 3-epimerase [Nitrospiraceae bacterium]|nr:ribulose-phosphate 3-epimerase [Nitrospiraceae bacterium]
MIRISPSLLSADFSRLAEEVRAAEEAGAAMLHVDVMDGHFVPNITIGPVVVEALKKVAKVPLDVHLMISDPDRYIPDFIKAGADILTVHLEATAHLHRSVQSIRERGVRAGVSINPATPVRLLEDIIQDTDMVLLMSVNPGFGGQDFIPYSLTKLRQLKKLISDRGLKTEIEVDGGVKPENAREVADAGADILVMGSAFFKSGDYRATMEKIRRAFGDA